MKCAKCGCNLPDDSKFCQYCGSSISENKTSQIIKDEEKASMAPVQPVRLNLSAMDETPRTYGNYHVSGSDVVFVPESDRRGGVAPPIVQPEKAPVPTSPPAVAPHCYGSESTPTTKSGSIDSKQRSKTNPIWPILLVVLTICLVAFYITSINLKEEADQLKETNTSLKAEIQALKDEVASLEKKAKGNTANKTIEGTREFIRSSKANSYKASSKYYANTNVVVVEAGKTATLSVTCTLSDDLWLEWSNSNADAEWNDDWSYNTCTVSVNGKKAGTTVISFTAENSSKAFDVLVIVV